MLCCLEQGVEYGNLLEEYVPSALKQPFQDFLFSLTEVLCVVQVECERAQRMRTVGRPFLDIQESQLRFFVENNFKVSDMSLLVGCSKRTIEQRLYAHGLSRHNYTVISDDVLDSVVGDLCSSFPRSGANMTVARLRVQGINVQREKVRQSMRRVDPDGIEARMRTVLRRRKYNVCCPNALWHIDGYHKLIRWRFVVHGEMDGYSRLVMFLRVASNNRATTVLMAFLNAVDEFGLPSRVRTDKGGENELIGRYMETHLERGRDRSSIIRGKSTHNQRIERFWRDLFSGCVVFFYYFF